MSLQGIFLLLDFSGLQQPVSFIETLNLTHFQQCSRPQLFSKVESSDFIGSGGMQGTISLLDGFNQS